MLKKFIQIGKEELVFTVIFLLTVLSSLWISPQINHIDWKVIASLFSLMLLCTAFRRTMLLDKIALSVLRHCTTERAVSRAMIFTTIALAMFITNDVALLTVVPLTIIMARKANFHPLRVIVIETAAANIGSSLTPFGNPQNLYLYSFYQMKTAVFFETMLPFAILGIAGLLLFSSRLENIPFDYTHDQVYLRNPRLLYLSIVLFILVVLSIVRIIDYRIAFFCTLITMLLFHRRGFRQVDYFLIGTFILFFIFIGNITALGFLEPLAKRFLTTEKNVLLAGVILSQGISNVPAAILLSAFTNHAQALLLSVSIGGLGTLIASLANLISYKIYLRDYKEKRRYCYYFYLLNFTLLVFFSFVFYLLS